MHTYINNFEKSVSNRHAQKAVLKFASVLSEIHIHTHTYTHIQTYITRTMFILTY